MITYQVESFTEVLEELKEVLSSHYNEVEDSTESADFNPDYEKYLAFDEAGMLTLVSVRDNRDLIGYYLSMEYPMLNSKHILGSLEIGFYIKPEYRKSRLGLNLLKKVEEVLRELGVQKMFAASKASHPCDKLYLAFGMSLYNTDYVKILER
jgi:L-amino acid N-acyltransferase YncA